MFPILFSIGSLHFYSLSICIIVGWLLFSFVFWRGLRSQGVDEERIFDLTFYATIMGFVFSRLVFVLLNLDVFSESWLRIVAIWVTPGLSLYGGFIGGLITLIYLSRQYKVRLGHVLDAFGPAFATALIPGLLGAFLDGSYVGIPATVPWAVEFVGAAGRRHPVQIYEIIAMVIILLVVTFLGKRGQKKKWPYGLVGLWFFALFSVLMFTLEFFKDSRVYLSSLRANQWILIALLAETIGAFYVRGGGREAVRPMVNRVVHTSVKYLGGIYAKFSKRSS